MNGTDEGSRPATTQAARAAVRRRLAAVRRRVLLHRRGLAALLVGLAVLLGLHDLRGPGPASVEVWTTARDLAAGERISAGDLRRTAYAPGSVPAGAVRDPRRVAGRFVVAPLRRGTPVTDVSVLGAPLVHADVDRVVVPVRLGDPDVVALLRVGDRVDLVAVAGEDGGSTVRQATTVATAARVVALPRTSTGAAATGDPGAATGRLVVVAVHPTEVSSVVSAGTAGLLTVLLNG